MTSNVLPLHFAPSQASSSQNSNVDDTLEGYKIKSALPYKIFSTLLLIFQTFMGELAEYELHTTTSDT